MVEKLKEELKERMLKRLPTQKLNCDMTDNNVIEEAFESVEAMPKSLGTTKHGIILGDPMFFFINGHPIPVKPQYIHTVVLTGEDPYQVKIKFIAPGQIPGKKEHHQ